MVLRHQRLEIGHTASVTESPAKYSNNRPIDEKVEHTHILGNPVASNIGSSFRHVTRKAKWCRWVDSHALVQAGHHVLQLADRHKVNLLLALERRPHLVRELGQRLGVPAQQVRHTRKQRRRCLAARDNEQTGRHPELVHIHPKLVLLPQQALQEIRSLRTDLHALEQLLLGEFQMLLALRDQVLGHDEEQEGSDPGKEVHHLEPSADLNAQEDHGDPGMVLALFKAAKRLSKRKVANDVERRIIVPCYDLVISGTFLIAHLQEAGKR